MAVNGNPVAWAKQAEALGTQARDAFTGQGDDASAKLAEAVAALSWAVAAMADRMNLDRSS